MISAASSYDKSKDSLERKAAYRAVVKDGASILESDYPIEAAEVIKDLIRKDSGKMKYFQFSH